jgi:hypothetical protein
MLEVYGARVPHRWNVTLAVAFASLGAALATAACGPALRGAASNEASCPPGAQLVRTGCACRSDLRLVLGACTSSRIADATCGAAAKPDGDRCLPRAACERGRARDLRSGECLPAREVRAIAVAGGMLVADDERLTCPTGRELAVATGDPNGHSARLGCVPRPAPASGPACPAGAIASSGGACMRVYERAPSSGEGARVDVGQWLEAVVGPDGGDGAPPLCGALARGAATLDPAAAPDLRLAVSLVFPDNDVSLVAFRGGDAGGAARGPSPAVTAELDRFLQPRIEALRALGGTASLASITTVVRCAQPRAAEPTRVGAENDPEN